MDKMRSLSDEVQLPHTLSPLLRKRVEPVEGGEEAVDVGELTGEAAEVAGRAEKIKDVCEKALREAAKGRELPRAT